MFDYKKVLALLEESFPSMIFDRECYLSDYTYMKVGGKAALMTFPRSMNEIEKLLVFCTEHKIKCFVLGKGSNLIVNDEGVDALFINTKNLTKIVLKDKLLIRVEAGKDLKDVSDFALSHCLTGFEFASGIPGSIGGAIYMNAGAYDGEMKDVVVTTRVFQPTQGIITLTNEEQIFAYRKSIFSNSDAVILETLISLKKGNPQEIADKISDLTQKRTEKQPLNFPSSGSTFKRPEGYFAGKLITDAGLKGFQIGGVAVSEKHTGFLVNLGGATANDILLLIDHIRKEVFKQFNIMLEPEVKFLQKDGSFKEF
ncbi:MAG: UDP-N-acetylmuramate dehydrogenase [Brevinema sp.]